MRSSGAFGSCEVQLERWSHRYLKSKARVDKAG